MSTFNIDFFEFSFLVEACIPPRPIARSSFWDSVIDKHFHKMTEEERSDLYDWIKKNYYFQDGIGKKNKQSYYSRRDLIRTISTWLLQTTKEKKGRVNAFYMKEGIIYQQTLL
jgi:hypothetical protein